MKMEKNKPHKVVIGNEKQEGNIKPLPKKQEDFNFIYDKNLSINDKRKQFKNILEGLF